MENIVANISNVGFPVVLCIFLLLRFEKKIDELTKAITELVTKIK
ncbi:MAG: YvrJ family protein [Peptoniphilaceae bacterium]|nr:YvrJ family protein [Parvimonas sp.]MCI5997058.1 YvrJ family protein [Parvimonas sp.]MDD7764141.1 YvrJ family protein [Peptoniphilaceae bacterium]MDY3050745.1 YvrJ family protein [Parvimonas sp.]